MYVNIVKFLCLMFIGGSNDWKEERADAGTI